MESRERANPKEAGAERLAEHRLGDREGGGEKEGAEEEEGVTVKFQLDEGNEFWGPTAQH